MGGVRLYFCLVGEVLAQAGHVARGAWRGYHGVELGHGDLHDEVADAMSVGDSGGSELVAGADQDRKSTRRNSSHVKISYAVFCLKKKRRIAECPTSFTQRIR